MRYVKLPENWWELPQVAAAGPSGKLVYLVCQTYIARHLTDSHIPRALVPALAFQAGVPDWQAAVAELLAGGEASLWQETPGGYYDRYYLGDNWSRQQHQEYSESRVENGKKGGRPRGSKTAKTTMVSTMVSTVPTEVVENHSGLHGAKHGANHTETIAKASSSNSLSSSDLSRRGEVDTERGSDHEPDRASVDVRANAPTPLRPNQGPTKVWLRGTYRSWVASYPKGVPDSCKDAWAEVCRTDDDYTKIMAGTAAWRLSRQWLEDGPGWSTKPEEFLLDRMYLYPPLPWRAEVPAQPTPDAESNQRREYPQPGERRENPDATERTRRQVASLFTPTQPPPARPSLSEAGSPALEAGYSDQRRRLGP